MPINKNELTKEQIINAMQCKNADELIALAKGDGYELTKAEAEAYLAELSDLELDNKILGNLAGGTDCYHVSDGPTDCVINCFDHTLPEK